MYKTIEKNRKRKTINFTVNTFLPVIVTSEKNDYDYHARYTIRMFKERAKLLKESVKLLKERVKLLKESVKLLKESTKLLNDSLKLLKECV